MANVFHKARETLQSSEEEYIRLGETIAGMNDECTVLERKMAQQQQHRDKKNEAAKAAFEAEVEAAQRRYDDQLRNASQEHGAQYVKLKERQDEMKGLIQDHEIQRQNLIPEISETQGLHIKSATAFTERRTSRSSMAAQRPISDGGATHAGHVEISSFPSGHNAMEISIEGSAETLTDIEGHSTQHDPAEHNEHAPVESRGSTVPEEGAENVSPHVSTGSARKFQRIGSRQSASSMMPSSSAPITSVVRYGEDDWVYKGTPTKSRAFKYATAPSHAEGTLIDYDEPENGDLLSGQYSHVIALNGHWHQLACCKCGANATQDRSVPGFFNGWPSLRAHLRAAHGVLSASLESCTIRTFDWDEVQRLREGVNLLSRPLELKRYRRTSLQNAVPAGLTQIHASSAIPMVQDAATSGEGSGSARAGEVSNEDSQQERPVIMGGAETDSPSMQSGIQPN